MTNDDSTKHHICPWYMAYLFDNPLRGLLHDPAKILGPYLQPGMTAVDIGCGMGFYSLGMARLVGKSGKILSVDLQPQMLRIVEKRARKKGLSDIIETHLTDGSLLDLDIQVDLALCFWMVHEVPDQDALFKDLYSLLRPGGHLFIAEPAMHVTGEALETSIERAQAAGFDEVARPRVKMSSAVVFQR